MTNEQYFILVDDRHQEMVIKLLYHFSYDNDVIAQFAYTECVSLVGLYFAFLGGN